MLKSIWTTISAGTAALLAGWQSYLAVAAIFALLGSMGTWRVLSWNAAAAQTHQAQQAVRLVVHQDKLSLQVSMNFEALKAADQAASGKLSEEVPLHVTPQMDRDHPVPCGFVRLYNTAAHDPVPGAACGPDDAASGVALSDVARTTVTDFGQYDAVADQLKALQAWVRQQQGLSHDAP